MAAGRRKTLRGQSLVEVAISLPVLLLLALGVTDIGRAFYYREAVTNSARQALRIAVSPSQHATADAVCAGAGGPSAVTVTTAIPPGGSSIASIVNIASLESSSNGTAAGSVISGGTISITFHCLAGKGEIGSERFVFLRRTSFESLFEQRFGPSIVPFLQIHVHQHDGRDILEGIVLRCGSKRFKFAGGDVQAVRGNQCTRAFNAIMQSFSSLEGIIISLRRIGSGLHGI